MTRWTDWLLASLGLGGREPQAARSEAAKRGTGQDDMTLSTTADREPLRIWGTEAPEELRW
jgi:hypothetical protein